MLLAAFGVWAAPGCSWLLLAAPGFSWMLLAAPGGFWLLLAALRCFWLVLAASFLDSSLGLLFQIPLLDSSPGLKIDLKYKKKPVWGFALG